MAIMTSAGAIPSSPQSLLSAEIAAATLLSPGLTANLPGSLIEDMASTAAGAVVIQDQAFVDLVNSISPFTANASILYALGAVYGVMQGQGSNTSAYITFTGTPGFVISVGFLVSDGTHQYVIQDGGIIATGGSSSALYAISTTAGSWAVPEGSITQIITSIPTGVVLTCINLSTGIPGATAQSLQAYQAQVIQAGQSVAQGMPTFLKTQLQNVPGVQSRLISIQQSGSNWQIIVGGGDPYAVGNAIFTGIFDISNLIGSVLSATSISNATNGVVTTNINHEYATGAVITIAGATPSTFNGTYTITVLTQTTFNLNVNTTSFGTYTGNGVITPNARNIVVSINDYPNTYNIPFINPPAQAVNVALSWSTTYANYVSPTSVAAAGIPAIVSYINSITVGQPINIFELQSVFQQAIINLIATPFISKMNFTVQINGVTVLPSTGTGLIYGDAQSFFETTAAAVTVTQS